MLAYGIDEDLVNFLLIGLLIEVVEQVFHLVEIHAGSRLLHGVLCRLGSFKFFGLLLISYHIVEDLILLVFL